MSKDKPCSALLDCSFLIRLLNNEDNLHENAKGYFKYFLEEKIILKVSTIAIAEYCVKGDKEDLPWENIQVVPFTIDHAIEAGRMGRIVFDEKERRGTNIQPRSIIPNDTKMFAQANKIEDIAYFVSSDSEAVKIYDILQQNGINFDYVDIKQPHVLIEQLR